MERGDRFPDFKLLDENGEIFDSKMLEGVRFIMYLYSGDNDLESVIEASDFNDVYPKLILRNIPIIGVSGDDPVSHQKFIKTNGLKIKLLTDTDHEFSKKVDAWKETEGVVSSTFVINKKGTIDVVWHNVIVKGHADQVYDRVKSMMKL
ncbi:MAG: peroxiredoxin [Candidatus Methanomethylophilaceae archaeon]